MSEPLCVQGGYNTFDPLRDAFVEAELPVEQNLPVQQRCEGVWKEVTNLCLRYADTEKAKLYPDACVIQTPSIIYRSQDLGPRSQSSSGIIALRAAFELKGNTIGGLDFDKTVLSIRYQLKGEDEPEQSIMVLGKNEIWFNTSSGFRAGGHGDLNYFRTLAWKIRDAAFPKNPAQVLEEQQDRELGRRLKQKPAAS